MEESPEARRTIEKLQDFTKENNGNLSTTSEGANTPLVEKSSNLRNKFTGLNHRLSTYMQHVKRNEALLAEKNTARRLAEETLASLQEKHAKQLDAMREELNERIRQAVLIEAQQAELQKEFSDYQEEVNLFKSELDERRKRENSLERILLEDREKLKEAREEACHLRDRSSREEKNRRSLTKNLTHLKVENATLKEKVRMASFELSMQESKVCEAQKRLQFTSEDVERKLEKQMEILKKASVAKLKAEQKILQEALERIRVESRKKLEETLVTYVSIEEHDKLKLEIKELEREIATKEETLARLDVKLQGLRREDDDLKEANDKRMTLEKKRRDNLNKKLYTQKKSQEAICQELATYRRLVESLDADGIIAASTPAKRRRMSARCDVTPFDVKGTICKLENISPLRPPDESGLMSGIEQLTSFDEREIKKESTRDCCIM